MRETAPNVAEEYRKANRDLTLKLAETCLESGVRKFVFVSTVKVMGSREVWSRPFVEQDPPHPDDSYGISKWDAEQGLVERFSRQSDATCIIIRLPMVYGPGNKGNALTLLKAASRKIPLPFDSISGKRSMIFVKNACDAILRAIEGQKPGRPGVQTYFVTDGHDLTSAELYSSMFRVYHGKKGVFKAPVSLLRRMGTLGSYFGKLLGRSLPISEQVISRLVDDYRFSSEAFCHDYDWHPPYSLKDAIRETVDWHKATKLQGM